MKKLLVGAITIGGWVGAVSAAPLIYEPFNYDATGNPELTVANPDDYGEIGTSVAPQVFGGNLSYPGLPWSPSGNHLKLDGTGPSSSATRELSPGRIAPDGNPGYHVSENPTVYYSMIFKVNDITTAAHNTAGSFIAGLRSVNTTGLHQNRQAGAPLLIVSANAERTAYKLGTSLTALDGRVFGSDEYTADDVLLLVFAYQLHSGNNVARMWVNPDPALSEAANASALKVEVDSSTASTIDGGRITNFFFRNNSASAADVRMDEVRVALSWEDVMSIPEPSSLALLGLAAGALCNRRRRR